MLTAVPLPAPMPLLRFATARFAPATLAAAAGLLMAVPARAAMTLDQACTTFAGKVNAAVASGDLTKARKIYAEGSKRVASRFNGATCPDVKAP